MPTESTAVVARWRARGFGPAVAVLLTAVVLLLAAAGCTRDEVGAAIATLAVQAQATLEPWGATVEANLNATATEPPALAAATTAPPGDSDGQPTAAASQVATVPATPVPPSPTVPTPTLAPTPTLVPTPTATPAPSPTPLPAEVAVPGGTMLLVAGSFFQMGAAADDLLAECQTFSTACQRDWFASAEPVHTVLLAPYYLDAHEVTNAAYVAFLNAIGGESATCQGQICLDPDESRVGWQDGLAVVAADRAQQPMAGVSWYGAAAYCAWREARLPSEAEWERAAAWDEATATARRYPWGDEFNGKRLNFCDATCDAPQANVAYNDGFAVAAPVASYADGRGPAGHYDLAGNVWEWVADWYDPAYYAVSPGADPTGPETGEQKVVRGGSWFDTAYFSQTAVRQSSPPDNSDATLGFRCAADTP